MKLLAAIAIASIMLVACGSSSTGQGDNAGTTAEETGYCAYGAVALMIEGGDIDDARALFIDMVAMPDAQPIDTPNHALVMIGSDAQTAINKKSYDAHRKLITGEQGALYLYTEYGHYLYIRAMHPVNKTSKNWHLECVQTSRDNFGIRIGIDVEDIVAADGTTLEVVVGGRYDGVEVGNYFIIEDGGE